jgi:hypothetical protein
MLLPMSGPEELSRGEWESLLHAPFCVYSAVAATEPEVTEAQFRCLRDEILAAPQAFADGTIGWTLAETLTANLDVLWAAYRNSGRHPGDDLKRARKALKKVPDDESAAIRDWLIVLGIRVARADRTVGEPPVSHEEVSALRDIAGWLQRPVPPLSEA